MSHPPQKLFLIFILFLLFLSCSSREDDSATLARKNGKPAYGGQLTIGVVGDLDTFNPLFSQSALGNEVIHLTLLGLADLNDKGEFVPELAESWEQSPDFLKLTYHLRKNARWSDGKPVSAYDVKFTFEALMDTMTGSPRSGYIDYVKNVNVVDSQTVVIEFSEAYPAEIFDTASEILPEHIFRNVPHSEIANHAFGRKPVASGPFVVNQWVSKQYIELVPNEYYYDKRPYLDKIIFKIVPDNTNLLTQLQTGEVDMLLDVPPEKIAEIKSNPQIAFFDVPGRVYNFIGYNLSNPLFRDVKIRQALTMALNRQEIIDALLYGFGKPCISPFLPMLKWAYNDQIDPLPFDPEAAKDVFAQNGWKDSDGDGWLDKNGEEFHFTLKTNAGNSLRSDVAVVAQEQWRKIGIHTEIEVLEWNTFLDDMSQGKFDAYLGGLSSSLYIDPTPIYHSSAVDLFNFVGYASKRADQLIEQGRVEMRREQAAPIWKELQQVIYQDQPYTYLFWVDRIVAVNKRFMNVTPATISSLYDIEKWYLAGTQTDD